MPRVVATSEKLNAIRLMREGMGQRDIERETGLSRPYIRSVAKEIGHKFPRNGIEVKGKQCMCANCGLFFRRPPSKVNRAERQFCDTICRTAFFTGVNHPNYGTGSTLTSFSSWCKNQSEYEVFRQEVLSRANYKCEITGVAEDLDVHHRQPKCSNPELVFDPNNGMVLSKQAHKEVHAAIRSGMGFEEAIEFVKNKYSK